MNKQIIKCAFEMFSDRDYEFSPDIDFDSNIFNIYKNNNKSIVKFIFLELKANQIKEVIKSILNEYEDKNIHSYFIIVNSNYAGTFDNVEIMNCKHFKFNITKHVMTNKHQLISEDELVELTKKGIKNLPIISISDPMVRWYGWNIGQICKITRPYSFFYRLIK